jgi:hypothetical protein
VPNILTGDALKRLKIPTESFSAELPAMVRAGLERLDQLQREDGGWGWFDNDSGDPFMTACAVGGLSEAKQQGFAVDDVRLRRGATRLCEMAKTETDLNRLAFECYALSRLTPCSELDRLVAAKGKLTPYALATGALALHRAARASDAADFVKALTAAAKDGHWVTDNWYYKWEDVAIETTAFAVLALLEIDPKNGQIAPAVAWMVGQQADGRWKSTKDTAVAVHAILAHTVATGGELDPLAQAIEGKRPELLKKVVVRVNGEAREILIDINNLLGSRFQAHFPGSTLKQGRNEIDVECPDQTGMEIECVVRVVAPLPSATPKIAIAIKTDRALEALHVGDEVEVTVTVTPSEPLDYVMISSPVAAGCEVIRGSGVGDCARFEGRFEEALFYVRALQEPMIFKYKVRSLFAGSFTIREPSAAVMYDESQGGRGRLSQAVVKP